jgi:hypothetical protein
MDKALRFEATISDAKPINPQFSKAKARILYTGKNRNNTYFSKEAVEKMLPTLYNIPVVGEYKEKSEDFGTHGGKIEISDEGFKWIETTKPYGVVPSDAEVGWETVTEDDGTEREYLYCTVYLWTGRYPEALKVIENNSNNQSMEIAVNEADWNDTEGYYDIKDAIFSALCILGQDVEPCFESANITTYHLSKEKFKEEFMQMIKELKFALENPEFNINTIEEGGNDVKEVKEVEGAEQVTDVTKTIPVVEDTKEFEAKVQPQPNSQPEVPTEPTTEEFKVNDEGTEKTEKDVIDEVPVVEPETTKDFTDKTVAEAETGKVEGIVESPEGTPEQKFQIIFELSHDDIRGKLYDAINPVNDDGRRDYNYWIIEVFQTYFIAQDAETYDNYFKFPYMISDNESVTVGEPVKVKMEWVETGEEVITGDDVKDLKSEIESLRKEVEELRGFKLEVEKVEKQAQIDELFSGFSEYVNEPEYQALLASAMEMEVSLVEEKLFALVGRKKFTFTKKENKKDTTKIVLPNKDEVATPYGVASKYFEDK